MKTVNGKRYTVQTQSGKFIEDLDKHIRWTDINIDDVAHGLSHLCRFSGQITKFYSVAAHSILVSEWIERNGGTPLDALYGLLHDASEAYITDMPMPVKVFCPEYYRIEENIMKAVRVAFELPATQPDIVTFADAELLRQEFAELFKANPQFPWLDKFPKAAFLKRFRELTHCLRNYRYDDNLDSFVLIDGRYDQHTLKGNNEERNPVRRSQVRRRQAKAGLAAKKSPTRNRKGSKSRSKKV